MAHFSLAYILRGYAITVEATLPAYAEASHEAYEYRNFAGTSSDAGAFTCAVTNEQDAASPLPLLTVPDIWYE
jgi:hypothetical protein